MWSRLFSCFHPAEEVEYQPVPADAVQPEPFADNTELFNRIPADVLVLIASFLPREDLIPFFLTTKKLLHVFEDFGSNQRISSLKVFMPTSPYSLYQGAQAQVSFRDVNHVLMAQYMLKLQLDDVEKNKDEIDARAQKRECVVLSISITAGVVIGLAMQAGMAAYMDQVCLPHCAARDMAEQGFSTCKCAGNICQSSVPDLGYHMGKPVADSSLCWYRCENIFWCYTIPPMIPSCLAGWGIGALPICYPIHTYLFLPRYYEIRDAINNKLRMLDSSRYGVLGIVERNQRLREHKVDGAAYRMFASRAVMVDDAAEALPPVNPETGAHDQAPGFMRME